MMKKTIAMLLVAALMLIGAAMAETYSDDMTFIYDENCFEISMDDKGDGEHLVILTGTKEEWGDTYIRLYLGELGEGESIPTLEDYEGLPEGVVATQSDWLGFHDVIMYSFDDEDATEDVFVVPVDDQTILSVSIGLSKIEDEEISMGRSDMISEVVDTLKVGDAAGDETELYTDEDIDAAIETAMAEADTWEGIEIVSIDYAGDACNSEENLAWLSGLDDKEYVDVLELLAYIHTSPDLVGALEPDTDYSDYQFWLAREQGGDWELVTWGY